MLTTIGWLATLYAWRQKWQRQQQAWQWWQQQQATHSHHTAESIRDGLLQQTFGFRRYLETLEDTISPPNSHSTQPQAQTDQWLARFKTFHQSLETLSDELSPPFVADSLPHALQFTLNTWHSVQRQSAQTLPACQIELPQDWPEDQSTSQQNQTLLSTVKALLNLMLPPEHTASQLIVKLSYQDVQNMLMVTIAYSEPLTPQAQPELEYLKEVFHSLTAGQLEITHKALSITGCFSWQNNKLVR